MLRRRYSDMTAPSRVAVQVPIKHRASERVPNKNFHPFHGKPLCYWLLDELLRHCPADWDVYVDSENPEVFQKLTPEHQTRFRFHQRAEWYASNEANGNHMLQQFANLHPEYDFYAQIYITAVMLSGSTVVRSIDALKSSEEHDSVLLVTEENGWIWFRGGALNYDPGVPNGLPRSQDAQYIKETTGLYAVKRDVLFKYGCRVGRNPLFFAVPKLEALDIDTLEDLQIAERLFRDRTT